MRTVYLGTSDFAAGVLQALAKSAHAPALALTRPDRPRGRGRKMSSPPVADRAQRLGIPLLQPLSVNSEDTVAEVEAASPDAIVVCAFGALIREPLLSLRQMLNVHPSLLPRWRGAAPIERAIMAGDERTGVSIMRLTEGLDSGPVCLAEEEEIAPEDDYGSLADRLCEMGGRLIVRTLDLMEAGEPLSFEEQSDEEATYAEKIGPEDRLLNPERGPEELVRVVRALHPHIGARIVMPGGEPLGVCRAVAVATGANGGAGTPAVIGGLPAIGILAEVEGRLLYGVSGGALELLEVQPSGKRAMDAQAYLRGHAL